jgi:hypothetical protein
MVRWDRFTCLAREGLAQLVCAMLLVLATGVALRAQSTSHPAFAVPIAVGDTVQVDAPPGVPTLTHARIVELRPSSIVLHADGVAGEPVVPFEEVRWLAVRRGTRGHTVAGLLVGLASGAVISGALYSFHSKNKPVGATISEYTVVGAAAGGVAGAVVGTTIRGDNWVVVAKGKGIEDFGMRENERGAPVD